MADLAQILDKETHFNWRQFLPVLSWGKQYRRDLFVSDLIAGLIVAIMLVPQSMAYALLAGLPPQVGLYASIVPLIIYGLLGTSRCLAVGPVAMVSLLVAASIGPLAADAGEFVLLALTVIKDLSKYDTLYFFTASQND